MSKIKDDDMLTIKNGKQQITSRLTSLGSESLSRSHNSVNISFAEMLGYFERFQGVNLKPEISLLLQTYRNMAEQFYMQFELSLLNEIERQRDTQLHSAQVIGKMNDLKDLGKTELETAIRLLTNAGNTASHEYSDLVTNFPALLQTALDKLKTEWQRLNTIANSSLALGRDDQLLRALEAVVKAAAYSVGIEADRITIVPGDDFALYFFSYMDNFAVLTVPIHSVRAPWEWSIFWHELAGYRVRRLKSNTPIDEIKVKIKEFHARYKNGDEDKKHELQRVLDVITSNEVERKEGSSNRRNRFSKRYLTTLLSKKKLVLTDLGTIEYQFERVLENLRLKDKFQAYENIKALGWCVDWFEELFEDAFSVMAIREPFLDFFEDVLRRHASADGRHPSLSVRLQVAKELLRLMNSDVEAEAPATMEESAAQQILKFISLLLVASHQFDEQEDYTQSMLKNIVRYNLPEAVGREIGTSIKKWSENFLNSKNRVKDAREEAEEFINMFSAEGLEFISIFETRNKKEILPSHEKMLEGRNYKELLSLSFFERDFFTGLDISNVECFVRVGVAEPPQWKQVFQSVESNKIINSLMTNSGEIRFTVKSTSYQTTIINWNKIFPTGDKYHIS